MSILDSLLEEFCLEEATLMQPLIVLFGLQEYQETPVLAQDPAMEKGHIHFSVTHLCKVTEKASVVWPEVVEHFQRGGRSYGQGFELIARSANQAVFLSPLPPSPVITRTSLDAAQSPRESS
ncbi:unnamed protein product [Caretta caretta]